jgi:hypothetical protein
VRRVEGLPKRADWYTRDFAYPKLRRSMSRLPPAPTLSIGRLMAKAVGEEMMQAWQMRSNPEAQMSLRNPGGRVQLTVRVSHQHGKLWARVVWRSTTPGVPDEIR